MDSTGQRSFGNPVSDLPDSPISRTHMETLLDGVVVQFRIELSRFPKFPILDRELFCRAIQLAACHGKVPYPKSGNQEIGKVEKRHPFAKS